MFLVWVKITSTHEHSLDTIVQSYHIRANILHCIVIELAKLIVRRSQIYLLQNIGIEIANIKQLLNRLTILKDLLESYAEDFRG